MLGAFVVGPAEPALFRGGVLGIGLLGGRVLLLGNK